MTLRQRFKSEYKAFKESKFRCNNINSSNYDIYGGRGIEHKIETFEIFLDHIGPKPSKNHSLDRIDTNGNYEIGNIRWATSKEQNRNKRNNRIIEIDGESKTLSEWCEIYKITQRTANRRINRYGWCPKKALSDPIRESGRKSKSGIKYLYRDYRRNRWNVDARIEGTRYIKTFLNKKDAENYIKEIVNGV